MEPIQEPKEQIAVKREISLKSGTEKFRIRQISDTHQDSVGFRTDLFNEFIRLQKEDKNSVWIHTGDLIDSDRGSTRKMKKIMFSDRHEAWSQEDLRNLDWLDRRIIPQYAKIKDSCVGVIDGDHYLAFANGMTSGKYIAYKLKVPYLGERSAFVNLTFNYSEHALQYVIHARHGKAGSGTVGNSVNSLVNNDVGYFADLHLGGHNHKEHTHPHKMKYVNTRGYIKDKLIFYMRGGSFLDGFPASGRKTYAYRQEYNPLPCGWGEVELTFGRDNENKALIIRTIKGSVVAA